LLGTKQKTKEERQPWRAPRDPCELTWISKPQANVIF
jgi:hypothetical protein